MSFLSGLFQDPLRTTGWWNISSLVSVGSRDKKLILWFFEIASNDSEKSTSGSIDFLR